MINYIQFFSLFCSRKCCVFLVSLYHRRKRKLWYQIHFVMQSISKMLIYGPISRNDCNHSDVFLICCIVVDFILFCVQQNKNWNRHAIQIFLYFCVFNKIGKCCYLMSLTFLWTQQFKIAIFLWWNPFFEFYRRKFYLLFLF